MYFKAARSLFDTRTAGFLLMSACFYCSAEIVKGAGEGPYSFYRTILDQVNALQSTTSHVLPSQAPEIEGRDGPSVVCKPHRR